MFKRKSTAKAIHNARELHKNQTKSEGLLWSILRARQVCGLKFRRQHPIGHCIADNACIETMLIVEIDGGYHDQTTEKDLSREAFLRSQGWKILRFTDEQVEQDAEAVALAIAATLGLPYSFAKRDGTGAGFKCRNRRDRR